MPDIFRTRNLDEACFLVVREIRCLGKRECDKNVYEFEFEISPSLLDCVDDWRWGDEEKVMVSGREWVRARRSLLDLINE